MTSLKRTLSFKSTLAIVIGGILGSGIFMKPAFIANELGSPLIIISVWLVAGLIVIIGSLSNAEVAAMFPETGGQYIFFQKMYGEKFAFLYGWTSFSVFNTAGNASIAFVAATYISYFIPLPQFSDAIIYKHIIHLPFIGEIYPFEFFGLKMLTALLIIALSLLNYFSVKAGSGFQKVITFLQISAIFFIIAGLGFSNKGSVQNLLTNKNMPTHFMPMLNAYIACLSAAFWAYDGWNNVTFLAGEVKNPQKVIPKSLTIGILTCITIFVLLSLSFMYVLPIDVLAKSHFVGSDAAKVAFGAVGGIIITIIIIIVTTGTANACILSTARVTYSMGQANHVFSWAGKQHLKNGTPGNALLLNASWSILLIFSGSFDILTDMLIFATWFFYGMTVVGLFVLRKKMKDVVRPYKAWGYPVMPIIFIVFVFLFLALTIYSDIDNYLSGRSHLIKSVFGAAIACLGFPIYYFSKKKSKFN